jgi:superoxide dismutase, Fe-Mn family
MSHTQPPLPYAMNALAPAISQETIEYHYGKHHATYIKTLNDLIKGTEFEDLTLEDTIRKATGPIFNNAAQAWNHTFYWQSMSPQGGGDPKGPLAEEILKRWNGIDAFREAFEKSATSNFGSGWTWLVQSPTGALAIENTSNAQTPIAGNSTPLLTCDVWEHAYYIDYRNKRPDYLRAFWKLVNWDFAAARYQERTKRGSAPAGVAYDEVGRSPR